MLSGPVCDCACPPQSSGKTSYPLLTRCFRRHLLRAKERLPLAAFAPRLPSLVFRLLPFQEISIERTVVAHPQGRARGREEEGEQGPPTNSGHHGLPERQNHGRICPPKRLRRPQERQRAQASPPGGHLGSSALGVRQPSRRTR